MTSSAISGRSSPNSCRAVVSSVNSPSSTRRITTSAVKPLVTLATANTVDVVTGTPWARSAMPNARSSTVLVIVVDADDGRAPLAVRHLGELFGEMAHRERQATRCSVLWSVWANGSGNSFICSIVVSS